jgi:hypothetical protein
MTWFSYATEATAYAATRRRLLRLQAAVDGYGATPSSSMVDGPTSEWILLSRPIVLSGFGKGQQIDGCCTVEQALARGDRVSWWTPDLTRSKHSNCERFQANVDTYTSTHRLSAQTLFRRGHAVMQSCSHAVSSQQSCSIVERPSAL